MKRQLAAVCAVATWLACSEHQAPGDIAPPARPQASLILEPPSILLGEIATLDLVVTTAPDFLPRPIPPPGPLPGLWLQGVDVQPVEVVGQRWTHRTRLRVRARELGQHVWPGSLIEIETPDGGLVAVATDPLVVDVRAEISGFEGRDAPFGVLLPDDAAAASGSFAAGAAVGSLGTLLGVGLVALLRRHSRQRGDVPATPAAATPSPDEPPWVVAHAALAELRTRSLDADARVASHLASGLLRRYVCTRFGVATESLTTEELGETLPPLGATTPWPRFVAIAADLDAVRFRPRARDAEERQRESRNVAALIERIESFVSDSIPGTIP